MQDIEALICEVESDNVETRLHGRAQLLNNFPKTGAYEARQALEQGLREDLKKDPSAALHLVEKTENIVERAYLIRLFSDNRPWVHSDLGKNLVPLADPIVPHLAKLDMKLSFYLATKVALCSEADTAIDATHHLGTTIPLAEQYCRHHAATPIEGLADVASHAKRMDVRYIALSYIMQIGDDCIVREVLREVINSSTHHDITRRAINLYGIFRTDTMHLEELLTRKSSVVDLVFEKVIERTSPRERVGKAYLIWKNSRGSDETRLLNNISMHYLADQVDVSCSKQVLFDVISYSVNANKAVDALVTAQTEMKAVENIAEALEQCTTSYNTRVPIPLAQTGVRFTRKYASLENKDLARSALSLIAGIRWSHLGAEYAENGVPYNIIAREELAKIPAPTKPTETELLKKAFL